ncbi:MAG: ferredoxin family protein [Xanthobacteraceae bacterium]
MTCQVCVAACPQNVFDKVSHQPRVIARPEDCQTCFLCELYCAVNALYVSPLVDRRERVNEQELIAAGLLGSVRRAMGWNAGRPGGTDQDLTHRLFEEGLVPPDPEKWEAVFRRDHAREIKLRRSDLPDARILLCAGCAGRSCVRRSAGVAQL